jgi:hypothetical protein
MIIRNVASFHVYNMTQPIMIKERTQTEGAGEQGDKDLDL